MNRSWQLGRIFGIDIKLHLTFFILLIWVGFSAALNGGTGLTMLVELFFILALFLSVVLHELGHALMAKRFGISTKDITLLPIGGVAHLERIPEDPKEEFLVSIAGPAVNFLIGGIVFIGLLVTGFFSQQTLSLSLLNENLWLRFLTTNLTLGLFNLIPAFPMDGGRVLRSLLANTMPRVKATRIAAATGYAFALIIGIAGFFLNPWLILIALFIGSGAKAEVNLVNLKADLEGLEVRDALVTKFYQVDANESLSYVYQMVIQTGQRHIPVVSNSRFLGFIEATELAGIINRLGDRSPAYAAIRHEPAGVNPNTPLIDILAKFSANRLLPVMEEGKLIGYITPESVEHSRMLNRHHQNRPIAPSEETDHQ
jgi:Zn-dependent protease